MTLELMGSVSKVMLLYDSDNTDNKYLLISLREEVNYTISAKKRGYLRW